MPAIFGSEVFPSPVLEQIGREAGVEYVDELRDDDLPGEPGDAEHSWLGLMRFDYVTMTEALGGDAVGARGVRGPQRRSRRGGVPAMSDRRRRWSRLDARDVLRYGGTPVLVDVDLVVVGRAVHRHRRTVRVGQDHAAEGAARHRRHRSRARSTAAAEPAHRLRAAGRDGDWNFPVTVAECVLMARTRGRVLPWRSRAEQAEVDAGADAARHRGPRRPPHPRAVRRPAAAGVHRPGAARRPELLLMDEPTSGVDVRTRHEVLHLLDDLHDHGLAIVLTTHDLNGIATHLPHLVCLNTEIIGEGTPREVLTADILERTYGARMEILEHAGMPVVLDHFHHGTCPPMRQRTGS